MEYKDLAFNKILKEFEDIDSVVFAKTVHNVSFSLKDYELVKEYIDHEIKRIKIVEMFDEDNFDEYKRVALKSINLDLQLEQCDTYASRGKLMKSKEYKEAVNELIKEEHSLKNMNFFNELVRILETEYVLDRNKNEDNPTDFIKEFEKDEYLAPLAKYITKYDFERPRTTLKSTFRVYYKIELNEESKKIIESLPDLRKLSIFFFSLNKGDIVSFSYDETTREYFDKRNALSFDLLPIDDE